MMKSKWDYRIARSRLCAWLNEYHGYGMEQMARWSHRELLRVCEDVMLQTDDEEIVDVYEAFLRWENAQRFELDGWDWKGYDIVWSGV